MSTWSKIAATRNPGPALGLLAPLALLALISACQDGGFVVLHIDGQRAQPPVTAPDRVERLDLRVEKDRELVWTRQFILDGEVRAIDESAVLRPGPHLDDDLVAMVRAVGGGIELASAEIVFGFVPGQRQDAVLSLRWAAGTCFDLDGDGYGDGPACLGVDCDETSADHHADAQEICNGLDDDCDGQIDETQDLIAPPCARRWGVCRGHNKACAGEAGWQDCPDSVFGERFELVERSCDGEDNDCDGLIDPGCACSVGATRPCEGDSQGPCDPGVQRCVTMGADHVWSQACEGAVRPTEERCNQRDDNCNGAVDDLPGAPSCLLQRGVCAGSVQPCAASGSGWGVCDYGPLFEATETRCDGLDNDCDGEVDEQTACPSCQDDADCDDDNDCTTDHCVDQLCRFQPTAAGSTCTDGLFCTNGDHCDGAGLCLAGEASPCTTECRSRCNESLDRCQIDLPGTPCADDGVFCNGAEVCRQGICAHAGDPCPTTECRSCNEGLQACLSPAGTACSDDGLFCTGQESCDGQGRCVSSGDPCPGSACLSCNEAQDSCFSPVTETCDDGLYCTAGDHCNGLGACVGGDQSPCTEDCMGRCVESGQSCAPDPPNTPCSDDGIYCNGSEFCDGTGACLPDGVSPCPEIDCRHCQESNDTCFDPPTTPCDDGDACTHGDLCDGAGACSPGFFDNDVDGDLHVNAACGGDDCDDDDPSVPRDGRTDEGPICDADNSCRDGKDNDCDGLRDAEETACRASNFMCAYGPTDPIALGPPGGEITIYTDLVATATSNLFCLSDASRALSATPLLDVDFESGILPLLLSGTGSSTLSAAAQDPDSVGAQGLELCGDNSIESQAFDTSNLSRLLLSYALDENFSQDQFLFTEYSIDGGLNWIIVNLAGDNSQDLSFDRYALLLPKETAGTASLRVRWRAQGAAGSCSYLDDVSLRDLPPATQSRDLFRSHFETSEGNPAAPACSTQIVGLEQQIDTNICLHHAAQNPNSASGTQNQGLRYRRPASFASHTFLPARVPPRAQIEYTLALRPFGLDFGEYASLGFWNGAQQHRLGVTFSTNDGRYVSRGGLIQDKLTLDQPQIYFGLPADSPSNTNEGADFDDLVLRWTHASHDVVGPFVDNGDGSFTALIQSDLAGTTLLTCYYDDGVTLRATDGSGLDSAPLPLSFGP